MKKRRNYYLISSLISKSGCSGDKITQALYKNYEELCGYAWEFFLYGRGLNVTFIDCFLKSLTWSFI